MGQKVHPLGFRVGITKNHQSQWFARFHKCQYAQSVLEDRLLRDNLMKLFPELLNPVLKKAQKREGSSTISPKITHIKIERGFIPYEIGIQIHAGNCELLKSSIDHLKINQNLQENFQKNRRYFFDLKEKLNRSNLVIKKAVINKSSKKTLMKSNSQKRQKSHFQFRKSLLSNIIILKKGKKITRKLQKKFYSLMAASSLKKSKQASLQNLQNRLNKNVTGFKQKRSINEQRNRFSKFAPKKQIRNVNLVKNRLSVKRSSVSSFGQSRATRAFIDIFVSTMSQKFVKTLKKMMNDWNRFMTTHKENQIQRYGELRFAPLGYHRKWSLARLNRLQKQPLNLLYRLLKSLQKKTLKKMEVLKKQFATLGTISKMESFNYYQMVRFIKGLKQLIKGIRQEQSLLLKQKLRRPSFDSSPQMQQKLEKTLLSLTEKALQNKFKNIEDECRKFKFIDYLQKMVQNHRQKKIYLYLSTISDARKYLRKIQHFTRQQANSLFGVDLNTLRQYPIEKQRQLLTNKVLKTFKQASQKSQLEKNVQDVFLLQMEKQRTMCIKNIELTPKISIKFYSVKPKNLETKASIIADSIVDDLEKRKAFRGVIKKAKDQLMANSKVKGVKIQVSGRLNGAEIARSEWVRAGRVPLQTLRANIDYCYKTANTIYGIIGVKIWIYKGYTRNKIVKK